MRLTRAQLLMWIRFCRARRCCNSQSPFSISGPTLYGAFKAPLETHLAHKIVQFALSKHQPNEYEPLFANAAERYRFVTRITPNPANGLDALRKQAYKHFNKAKANAKLYFAASRFFSVLYEVAESIPEA